MNDLELLVLKLNHEMYFSDLWARREEFFALPQEEVATNLLYQSGLTILEILRGRLEAAERIALTPPAVEVFSIEGHEIRVPKRKILELILPQRTSLQFVQIAKELYHEDTIPPRSLSLTAGRPFLMNGFRDLYDIVSILSDHREEAVPIINHIYGGLGEAVLDIMQAECHYQRNECMEALLLISGRLGELQNAHDSRCMFAALYLQLFILLMNGQSKAAKPIVAGMRERMRDEITPEFAYNMDAVEVMASLYDGELSKVRTWMEEKAPDEFGDYTYLDAYRYMVKLHCYLIMGKHMALVALAERMRELFTVGHRNLDCCELDLLLAMSFYEQKDNTRAFYYLERALVTAEKYRFDRMIGDKGDRIYELLVAYVHDLDEKEADPVCSIGYLMVVMEIAQKVSIMFPEFLRIRYDDIPVLTESEINVLRLMEQGKTNSEIGEYLFVSINTVKFHSKNIFAKLDAKSRGQAIRVAKEYGII